VRLKPGGHAPVVLHARLNGAPPAGGSAEGAVVLVARGAGPLRLPWAISFESPPTDLITSVALSESAFKPSDASPAVLSFRAGLVVPDPAGTEIDPVSRLDVELWRGKHRLGLLARQRDLLPGTFAYGLTGRGPNGSVLARGRYEIRLLAVPTGDGPPTSRTVEFRIK
jgi:hypothetical protein